MGIYQKRKTIRPDVPCVPCDGEGRVEATCYGVLGVAECEECRGTGEAQCRDCCDAADMVVRGAPYCRPCHADREAELVSVAADAAYDRARDRELWP